MCVSFHFVGSKCRVIARENNRPEDTPPNPLNTTFDYSSMKPCHVLLRLMGVEKIILGSTGHSGRKAADQLVEYLKRGYSTVVMPDGPNGPPFILKKGILHMSLQSGVPIVAMQFISSDYFEFNTWDRKKLSYPFFL